MKTARLKGLVSVFEEFANHGLDPGVPRASDDLYGKSIIGALGELSIEFPTRTSEFLNLARIVLKKSVHDPFLEEDILLQSLLSHISGLKHRY